MTAVSRPRAYQGWPLLAGSFRPFFLLGSIYAGLAILVWLPVFYGEIDADFRVRAARLARP